jgi:16S rRNA (cytidine1402-2'-O)-methyltransferase
VIPAPGASAVLAALSTAGLATDRFLFAGFPPSRAAARRAFLEGLRPIRATLILFEGPSRLKASLADMAAVLGPRPAVVARELTKLHETAYRDRLDALAALPALASPKGEIVVVIAPPAAEQASDADAERALAEALLRLSPAKAAAEVAHALGLDRRALYRRALVLKGAR